MRSNNTRSVLKHAGLAASVLLLASGAAFGQQQINLTAGPAAASLPDGTFVPMWGYACDATQVAGSLASCAALNPAAAGLGFWSPVLITVPTGQDLQINLTNNLSFGATPNNIPTSLVIVGQLGGGLGVVGSTCGGSAATGGSTCSASPDHTNAQPLTWPIAADGPGQPLTGVGVPPAQGPRVQSFSTEVAAGTTANLCWGVCGAGGAALKPGTYLIESGTHPSIQGPMGLYGILVVTAAPTASAAGTAYGTGATAVTYNADVPLLFSEIDPVQNTEVNAAVQTTGFAETTVWSGLYGGCGNPLNADGSANPTYQTCYPPAVNYTPLYYLINGRGFDKTNPSSSLFAATAAPGVTTGIAGKVLVRLVNAGLRMHVPSIVGSQTGTAVAPTLPPAGFSLIAEDGNVLPGLPRVQSEVFMPAGKTNDVMINVPTSTTAPALPIFDRELSLGSNSTQRDGGMLAYISINGAGLPTSGAFANNSAVANPDTYNSLLAGQTLVVSDPAKGVIANDVNVIGVQVQTPPGGGTLVLNTDGTFTYTPNAGTTSDSFSYCGNGGVTCTTVTLGAAPLEAGSGITMAGTTYTANGTFLRIQPPGILAFDRDGAGYPLTVNTTSVAPSSGLTLAVDATGGFSASVASAGTYTFSYKAQNSQGTTSAGSATVTLIFPAATGVALRVLDGKDVLAARTNAAITPTEITDYRWIIEEDRTFYVNPNCTANPPPAGCPGASTTGTGIVPTFGTNFHTSYMPVVAAGCTGQLSCEGGQTIFDPASGGHVAAVCDQGDGICRPDPLGSGFAPHFPSEVHLDPNKRYYLTVFPGDAGNPFENANLSADCTNGVAAASKPGACGHGMGGAPLICTITPPATACSFPSSAAPLTVLTEPDPYPPSKLSVFVFEDDFPLNGEQDGGGGIDVLSPNEPGLGGFNITLFDDAGGTGDATGQMTYDMFNQPLVNSLAGTIDPATQKDACPISTISRIGTTSTGAYDKTQAGITGTIVTCPKYEGDGKTLSPLAGQAVIANLMPGRYGVVATPGADRIARGEEWLQTNTLDGQKAHDSFLRIGEPSFFQEFGPAGYHVSIGFANPKIINSRLAAVCNGTDPNVAGNCTPGNTVTGLVTDERMSRTPDERLYSSGDNSSYAFTQCYVSIGDPDGEDFAFTKCNADGTFTLSGLPDGDWRITVFDQWNDMLVDGLSTPVRLGAAGAANFCPGSGSSQHSCNMGDIAMNQWQANIYTTTFFDANGNGVRDPNETGLTLVPTNIRFRDGSYSNFNNTDLAGNAGFNEIFPLFSWYVIETDSTRYKSTGTHVVYDAGGPADGSPACTGAQAGNAPCGNSAIGSMLANTAEQVSVPVALRVPGAVYCADADCTGHSILSGPASSDPPSACTTSPTTGATTCTRNLSTGRIDPPWVLSEGWQGFSGQNSFIEFGKKPFAAGENGGIHGEVIYASTRPFDDPQLLLHTSWTPDVPGVTINLYQVGTAPDGSQSLKLVDHTLTSSWDDWAQGFRSDGNPNMNCPGQLGAPSTSAAGDLFFFTLFNQPMWLDVYNNGGTPAHTIPNNSQFKCYDGMHNWNQVQPAPYDGMYQFPSITAISPTTGKPTATNCTICTPNHSAATTDWNYGLPMLPPGQYVVEMIVPPGYELVKEEDKNILIGDNYIAPVTQEFPGLGSAIYILPDQASVAAVYNANQPGSVSGFNPTNAQNPTQAFGRMSSLASHEGDTGSVESFWPCVGATRIVPDYISLFPQSLEVAPFAGARRNLCDRKLVQLDDQTSALAKFWVFTSAHVAAHFTGVITDDFTSEFDPFSPQFGEKFSPANLPVAIKDWTGQEISRVYSDQWGTYNGLTYSTWEVNPPNPTGYAPTMMVTCMNDPGTGATPDPLYNPAYSQFCYEIPFMPGQTQYMDTPVVPTSAFAGAGYNNPDCDYPDATPAISEVDGGTSTATQPGPWVSASGVTLHIYALGTLPVNNYGYSGPSASTAPFNAKTVTRKYSFGTAAGSVALLDAQGVSHPLGSVSWGDLVITGTVPALTAAQSTCPLQQQSQYGGSAMTCGELVITAANGKQSIDTVTVTIGGKAPTHVAPTASIQAAIDAAHPGDMLMIDPATPATAATPAKAAVHEELLLMWKPVRLQGVGAVASVINANSHPAGKLDAWRRQVNCLFGLAINGQPMTQNATNPYDPDGIYKCAAGTNGANFDGHATTLVNFAPYVPATHVNPQIDRLPLEAIVGWDASQNGNMAELLQEPSLMGALEGAAITVLAKGMVFPAGSDPFGTGPSAAEGGAFPAGTVLLNGTTSTTLGCGSSSGTNPYPSNFYCNPSSIDGLTITDASQGGGGIFVHGWGHNIQIANNRVTNNSGTLGGGINVGQGEFPGAYTVGGVNADPNSCQTTTGLPTGMQLQYCFDVNVNMHHNMITKNSATGDELFSATPAGAGGVNICNGSDYYKFNYNWLCGNLSTGDGGGIAHIGFNYNGDIEHNSILFNQSTNPSVPTNGGGLLVMGAPDVDPTCGTTTDQDCLNPTPSAPSDGAGPGLMINANLIAGNAAEAGSGGGLRLQNVNGTDVLTFPSTPTNWYAVTVTNNIINNNVAGWDGAGISLQDALNVNIVNNTIMSNDTTASSGMLFNTLGAPLASSQGPCPSRNANGTCPTPVTTSTPQPAGIVAIQNSPQLTANLPATVVCPAGHFQGTNATNANCRSVSYPELYNNVIFQNRTFNITVGGLGTGALNQQNVVALVPTLSQPSTDATTPNGGGVVVTGGSGACVSGASYWDLGVRGDSGPDNHASGVQLAPAYSVLTDVSSGSGYSGATLHNTGANPTVLSQYCNGARVPPENGGLGYDVPPGIADATVPNPIFNLTPAATVDEGNNWINIAWGPLSLSNPSVITSPGTAVAPLGNYGPAAGSPAINYIPSSASTQYAAAPPADFYGNARKSNGCVDAGAVEFVPGSTCGSAAVVNVTGGPLTFPNTGVSSPATSSPSQTLTLHNTGTASATGIVVTVATTSTPTTPNQFARPAGGAGGTCGTTLLAGATCTINVVFAPTTTGAKTGTVTITANVTVAGSPVGLSGTGVTGSVAANLTPTSWTPSATRGCAGTACPSQAFTLTNSGNVNLTGIGHGTLGGANPTEFTVVAASSTCGPAGGAQTVGQTTLAPGASCMFTVRFTPLTTQSTGVKTATASVADGAGTQTSNLTGTAN
jgi:hypothetical protein